MLLGILRVTNDLILESKEKLIKWHAEKDDYLNDS